MEWYAVTSADTVVPEPKNTLPKTYGRNPEEA
jgi:hypothetical protein